MKAIRITDNKDIGNYKPKFRIGDKVKINEVGERELILKDRDGIVTEIIIVHDTYNEHLTSNIYYLTDGEYGDLGTWEEYLELECD